MPPVLDRPRFPLAPIWIGAPSRAPFIHPASLGDPPLRAPYTPTGTLRRGTSDNRAVPTTTAGTTFPIANGATLQSRPAVSSPEGSPTPDARAIGTT